MKKKILIPLTLLIMAMFHMNMGYSQSWELLSTGLSSSIKVHSIVFTAQSNYQTGYAVGGDNYTSGVVIKTTDGGTTWSPQNIIASEELYSVSFPTNDTGYTCSMEGKVYKTTNGGTSWQMIYSAPAGQCWAISFKDASHGVLGTPGSIRYTSNGGQTWQTGSGSSNTNSQDISWCEGSTYLATGYGETNITGNDGQSWNSQPTPALSLGCGSYGAKYLTTVGDYGTIRVSQDYGNTWIDHDNVGDLNHDAAYWDSNYIYVVGTPGIVLKSVNGGQSFSNDGNLGTGAVFCVFITPSFTIYATGSQGKIWRKQVAYPYPAIQVSADSILFDTIAPGTVQTKTFTVTNTGNQDLVVSGIASSAPEYSANPGSFTLSNGQTQAVEVNFAPLEVGPYPATLTISSNAPGQTSISVGLNGYAAFPVSVPRIGSFGVNPICYPNPFISIFNIDLETDRGQDVYFSLTDAAGKILYNRSAYLHSGKGSLDSEKLFPGSEVLEKGLYFLEIRSGKAMQRIRIVKI